MDVPDHPFVFAKFADSVGGPNDPLVVPRSDDHVYYEVELGVVISSTARNVAATDAHCVIAGQVNFNDVSARRLQMRTTQFLIGKTPDTFAPRGPALVTSD